jgi:hypothetical protein
MAKQNNISEKKVTVNVSRPGIHAKSKTSSLKTSKNYQKAYRGQGR